MLWPLRHVRKEADKYLFTVVIDLLFLGGVLFVGKYLGSLVPEPQQLLDIFGTQWRLLSFAFGYVVAYYSFAIFLYSLAKLFILRILEGKKPGIHGLSRFFLLNIILTLVIVAAGMLIWGVLLILFQQQWLKYLVLLIGVPFIFFSYVIFNISHVLFAKGERKKVFRRSVFLAFKPARYYGFLVWNLVFIIGFLAFLNAIHFAIRYTFFTSAERIAAYASGYLMATNAVFLIFAYLVIAFNRVYFFEKYHVLQQHQSRTI